MLKNIMAALLIMPLSAKPMDALRNQAVSTKEAIADEADSSISKAIVILRKDNSETALIKSC